jgi:small subunit ribosomal protein S6
MERHYETVFVVKPDIGEEAIKGIIGKATSVVEGANARDVSVDEWGRRKLAYPIEKKNEGYYFLMTYTAQHSAMKELERMFRLNEDVIRYQTVRLKSRAAGVEEPSTERVREEPPQVETKHGGEDEAQG